MKKKFFKAFFAVAAIATIGLGSYKAYGTYMAANMTEEDLLMAENIEAISQSVESSSNTYRKKVNVLPCFEPVEEYVKCMSAEKDHLDLYHFYYKQNGEHYTCKTYTYIPTAWGSKPTDECYSNKSCSSGTVETVPEGYEDGKPHIAYYSHS